MISAVNTITRHFYPWDDKPLSKISTCSVVGTVASTAMIVFAYNLQWGTPWVVSFSLSATASLSIPFVVIACKRAMQTSLACSSVATQEIAAENQPQIAAQLCDFINTQEVESFASMVNTCTSDWFTQQCIHIYLPVDRGDEELLFSVLEQVLLLEDQVIKQQLLTICLKNITDEAIEGDCVEAYYAEIYSRMLAIEDQDLISLCIDKMDQKACCKILENIKNLAWLKVCVQRYASPKIQQALPFESMCRHIVSPRYSTERMSLLQELETVSGIRLYNTWFYCAAVYRV